MCVFIELKVGSSGGSESRSGAGAGGFTSIYSDLAREIANAILLGYPPDAYKGREGVKIEEALGVYVEADWESPYTTRIIFRGVIFGGVNGEPGLTMDVTEEHDDLAIAMKTVAVMYFTQHYSTEQNQT